METTITGSEYSNIFDQDRQVYMRYAMAVPGAPTNRTTSALTYYVADTGDDSNDGLTATTPFASVTKALSVVPKLVNHVVTINVAEGTYDGFSVTGFMLGLGGQISIEGALGAPTLTTGTASGTATSGSTTSLTDSGQTWTVNELRGKLVLVAGEYRVVRSNTGTAIQFAGNFSATTNGKAYSIVERKSVFNTAAPVSVISGVSVVIQTAYCAGAENIFFKNLSVDATGLTVGFYACFTPGLYIRRCKVTAGAYGFLVQNVYGYSCVIEDSYSTTSTASGYFYSTCGRAIIRRSYAYAGTGVGVTFFTNLATDSSGSTHIYADGNTSHGMSVIGSNYSSLGVVYATGNGGSGFTVTEGASAKVTGGDFSSNGAYGLVIGSSTEFINSGTLQATGTITCSNNTSGGVLVNGGNRLAVSAITGTGNGGHGIKCSTVALYAIVMIKASTTVTGTSGNATLDDGSTTLTWAGTFAANNTLVREATSHAVMMRKD